MPASRPMLEIAQQRIAERNNSGFVHSYKARIARCIAHVLIDIGASIFFLELYMSIEPWNIRHLIFKYAGFITSPFYIAAALCAFYAGHSSTKYSIKVCLAFSIMSAVMGVLGIIMNSVNTTLDVEMKLRLISGAMAVCSLGEFIASIVSSVLCCKAVCDCCISGDGSTRDHSNAHVPTQVVQIPTSDHALQNDEINLSVEDGEGEMSPVMASRTPSPPPYEEQPPSYDTLVEESADAHK